MTEMGRIREQIRQCMYGRNWTGPAVMDILEGIDAAKAYAQPIPNTHSIWEIVLHLIGTVENLTKRAKGDRSAAELLPEEDWPPVSNPTEAAWQETVERLKESDAEFSSALENFPEDKLYERITDPGTTAYNNFHGYVQHTFYHLGQISMLKRLA